MQQPFFLNTLYHYYLAITYIDKKYKRVLDFGCGKGGFIGHIKDFTKELYGFDVEKEKIEQARKKYPFVNFKLLKVGEKLPYKDNFFDAVFMFHVLEHVNSESNALEEAYRVLKSGGVLFLASPYNGLFAWADTANLRYSMPNFHKWFMEVFLGKKIYQKRFVDSDNESLFGDCSKNRNWHKHYKREEIERLLDKHFVIQEFKRYGLFQPFLLVLYNFYLFMFKKESNFTKWVIWLDNHLNINDYSYFFFLKAIKK